MSRHRIIRYRYKINDSTQHTAPNGAGIGGGEGMMQKREEDSLCTCIGVAI